MAFTLFPKSIKFFELLIRQNTLLQDVAGEVLHIFEDFGTVDEACKRINLKEVEGDELCRDISHQLSQTFITPIDREDIYRLNLAQEDSINFFKSIATRTRFSGISHIRFPAKRMMRNVNTMTGYTGEMLRALQAKQEVGGLIREIGSLKGECEMLLSTGLSELQDVEISELKSVVDIIKWIQVYDRIEQVIERIDDLADAIEEVVLKNA